MMDREIVCAMTKGRIAAIRNAMEARDAHCAAGHHQPYACEIAPGTFIWWCRNPWCWWHSFYLGVRETEL